MAIWQFDIAFIPCDGPLPWLTDEGYEAPPIGPNSATLAQEWARARIGVPWNMTDDCIVYGAEQGNRIDMLINQDGSAEISARIDARSTATEFIRELCDLCEVATCKPFSVEGWKSLDATPAALSLALERSRAAAFVRDPKKVLREAASDV